MLRLQVARSCAEIEQLRPAWESLHTAQYSMFQSYSWNSLASRVFADREEPYFILAESDSGIAIIPAVIQVHSGTISFAGESLFDYRDYLAHGDSGPLTQAWRHLATLDLPLSICAVGNSRSPIWERLPKSFFSRALGLSRRQITAEEFAQSHARAFSRLRKLERMGFRIEQYRGDAAIVRRIYKLRAQQAGDGELFRDPLRVEFMVAACCEAGPACEVFALEHGGTLAAALVTFRDRDVRRCYTTYYDRGWGRYSPGVSLMFEIARRSLEQGLSLDLMTGEQSYKTRIAQDAVDLFQVRATALELRELSAEEISAVIAA